MMRVEIDPEEEVRMEAVPSDVNEMGSSEAMWAAIEEGPDEEAERIALRKASLENLYTPNIEALLEGLEGDLKVVHTVDPQKALRCLPLWKPAVEAELGSLRSFTAINRLFGSDAKKFLREAETVPSKMVFTVKPPSKAGDGFKRKSNVMSCGNFAAPDPMADNYSSGAQAETVRLVIAMAVQLNLKLSVTDVKNAFLRAPLPASAGKVGMKPPAALKKAGYAEEDEVWEVVKAVYGFRESPKWWGVHRDGVLKTATWTVNEPHSTKDEVSVYALRPTVVDSNLWKIVEVKDGGEMTVGYVVVYVDDILTAASGPVMEGFHSWLRDTWECSEPEVVDDGRGARFLGMEVEKTNGGYSLSQRGYLQDLLREYAIKDHALLPVPKEWCSVDQDEEQVEESDIKAAQSCVGALLWLSQRTRPDLSYAVALMGSWATKRPVLVGKMARRVMAYLNSTQDLRLYYEFLDQGYTEIATYTDASFAPQAEKSVGAAVVLVQGCAVAWRTGKQKMIATSSAEAELQAAAEGAQMMISIAALLKDMEVVVDGERLLVDNLAAICLASHESSSWRTRRLKLRANWLREQVHQGVIEIQHCPGDKMLADVITKPVASRRMSEIMGMWGLRKTAMLEETLQEMALATSSEDGYDADQREFLEDTFELMRVDRSQLPQQSLAERSQSPQQSIAERSQLPQQPSAEQQQLRSQEQHGRTPQSRSTSTAEPQHHTETHLTQQQLGWCLRLGVLIRLVCGARAEDAQGIEDNGAALGIDPAFDLYLAVLIVGVCTVIMWEMLKGCGRTATRAVRLRALATPRSRPLARQELERLRALLGRQQSTLTDVEFEELTSLAARVKAREAKTQQGSGLERGGGGQS